MRIGRIEFAISAGEEALIWSNVAEGTATKCRFCAQDVETCDARPGVHSRQGNQHQRCNAQPSDPHHRFPF